MLDYFVPQAQAQNFMNTVTNTAAAGTNAAVEGAQSGIQGFLSYVGNNIDNWIAGILVVAVFYILAQMSAATIKKTLISKRQDIQESVLILVERITRITVLIIGVTVAFAINGLNFTAVIGALSLGVGFALKDIIGNFISGVIMLSQNRVNIGDFIKVKGILGTIVSIDTRATILQAIDGTEIVIPNQTMLGETLISYTSNPFRRVEIAVGVDYKTDLPMVTSLIKAILEKDKNVVIKPAPSVLVDEFGESSINLVVRFWVESGKSWLKIRSNMAHKIKQAFDEVGVNIPFPIRTLKLDEDDRALLKTIDSIKKGLVPDKVTTPDKDQLVTAALHTENAVKIPYNLFENEEKSNNATPQTAPSTVQEPILDHRIEPEIILPQNIPAPEVTSSALNQNIVSQDNQTNPTQTGSPSTPENQEEPVIVGVAPSTTQPWNGAINSPQQ